MADYSQYSIEAACAVLICAIAHKIYKMRCDSSSKCCGETVSMRMHNEGEQQGQYQLSQRGRQPRTPTEPEAQV